MVWLTCSCLNVKIHVKGCGTELKPDDPANIGVDTEDYASDEFFTSQICLVQLDLEGVTKEYGCLVRERTTGDWTASKCVNCQTNTHAVHQHQGEHRVLVNTKLQFGTSALDSIQASPDYSPLYRILIPGRNDNQPAQSYGPRLGRFESLQQESLMKIQQQLNTYLITEEANMEDRIRQFEEQQRSAFSELQSRARRDKTKLMSVALSVEDHEVTDSLSEAMTESPLSPLSPGEQEISMSSVSSGSDKKNSNIRLENPEQKPRILQLAKPQPSLVPVGPKSPEADGMFDMEGFDEGLQEQDNGSFYETDEENDDNDTDDSSYSSDASMRESLRSSGHQRRNLYSTSLPMNVPLWTSRSRRITTESPDDREGPDDIGASIKAMAQSVRVDGTEIFGDLPRGSNKQFRTVEIMKR